jgi:phosphoglycolate phosphatase-like HAD superfamily hydrolase
MTDTQAKPTLEIQRNRAEQQARPDLEKWRNEAEQQALKTLDKDAIAAIEQTVQAIDSIAAGKTADALKGIEEATGKVNIVLARNPELALIPVSIEALIIDTAPRDIDDIEKLADAADKAILVDDFPTARALLGALRSEVRVRTHNLPLGLFPTALQEAAARSALERLGVGLEIPVITRQQVQRAKPDPDLFLAAAQQLNIPIARAMVVGDSVWDLLAARRAGCLGIGLLSGGYGKEELEQVGAYRVYQDPADLLTHLDEVGVRITD